MRLTSSSQDTDPSPLESCYGIKPVGTATPVRLSTTVPRFFIPRLELYIEFGMG